MMTQDMFHSRSFSPTLVSDLLVRDQRSHSRRFDLELSSSTSPISVLNSFMEQTSSERLLTTESKKSTADRMMLHRQSKKLENYVSQRVSVRTPSSLSD